LLVSKRNEVSVQRNLRSGWTAVAGAVSLSALLAMGVRAWQSQTFFDMADADHDGSVSRDEFRAATAKWLGGNDSANEAQMNAAMDAGFPASLLTAMLAERGPQNQTPKPVDVEKMMAALPSQAPAKPARARKVLVLSKAAGYVHSCIPLAARTVQELGNKTGAWTTTVTYDPADIRADNLKQYDLVFLNNTTGAFLDDSDPAVTSARKKALLEFVRAGKGLAGIHAAGDSYHEAGPGASGLGYMLAPLVVKVADTDNDKTVSAAELAAFSNTLFDKIDKQKTGKISDDDLRAHFVLTLFGTAAGKGASIFPAVGRQGPDPEVGTWPEFNKTIGGFFKYHWLYPQHIVYKIDDPSSPLTAMFRGSVFSIEDETYTFSVHSWSRKNLHVLTSIDYSKMSGTDKQKEDFPRPDHDYGLSWIRREGKGRVFYEAHGHDENVYALTPILEHLLAGMQYALGDLKADDSPSS
jgi:type 1 glutamine amidotransferase